MVSDMRPTLRPRERSSARNDLVFRLTRSSATPPRARTRDPVTALPTAVPFSKLVNEDFITPGYGPGDRADPFWSTVWPNSNGGPVIVWRSIHSELAMTNAGIPMQIRVGRRRHTRTAPEAIALLHRRRSRIITLGAVNLWRTATGQQLAAITGQPGLNSPTSDETGLLFDAGLIQRGRFCYPGVRSLNQAPEVFRPDTQADKVDLRNLRYADWLGATLGGQSIKGHQYDRHNILTTELSLRAGEICPLRSVLGEAAATWPKLFGSKLRPNPHRSADAVWIREDGLKIAVELTATITPATIKKIEQLAELLARDKSKSLVVLFVVAAQPQDSRANDVTGRLRQAVKKSAHSSMSRILAEVDRRMTIAKWSDWFPAPGLAEPEFVQLRAQRYSAKDDDWLPTNLLDPYDVSFPGADFDAMHAMFANLNDVLGTPWWMRTGEGADLDAYLIEKAGFPRV